MHPQRERNSRSDGGTRSSSLYWWPLQKPQAPLTPMNPSPKHTGPRTRSTSRRWRSRIHRNAKHLRLKKPSTRSLRPKTRLMGSSTHRSKT
ncbi:unnamed protein product [Rhizoctonia solani]|uniref:Uncharacterized protein n=1 Tax=Rhizoctonia solani TaxID=456999 RepID=A0A8H3CI11_9AGAM|nr:unnamed protein product [Rhizoctonia solani]